MRKLLLVVAVGLIGWALLVVPLPVASLEPVTARPVAGIVEVDDGITQDQLPAELLFTAVELRQPSTVGAAQALLDEHRELTLLQSLAPAGMEPGQIAEFQARLLRESIRTAVAMGLDAAGREVTVEGDGARVVATVPGSSADGVLQQEDVITEVDGRSVELASELAAMLAERPAGAEVSVTFRRDEEDRTETLPLLPLGQRTQVGRAGLGVIVTTVDLRIDAPVEARPAPDANVGGPSAGLMLALATYDAATDGTLGGGRTVAGTGTIDLSGNVGPVDGVPAKVHGAQEAGAEVFIVPEAQADEARAVAPDGMDVVAAASLSEAIDALADNDDGGA